MKLLELIHFEKPIFVHYADPEPIRTRIKGILALARNQGKLPIICSKLGISLRSIQRWLPTPNKRIKVIHKSKRKNYSIIDTDSIYITEEITKVKKRKNRKRKALNINKCLTHLLYRFLVYDESLPEKEPTNKEVMEKLLKLKKSLKSWQKVSQQLDIPLMTLYRIRKTGKISKPLRLLINCLIIDEENQPNDSSLNTSII